jgi:hypothetical protein
MDAANIAAQALYITALYILSSLYDFSNSVSQLAVTIKNAIIVSLCAIVMYLFHLLLHLFHLKAQIEQ